MSKKYEFLNILYKEVIIGSNLYNNINLFFDRIPSSLCISQLLINKKKLYVQILKQLWLFLKQFPQHNRCCHNTNSMALKHKKHTISNHVYAFDLHSYDWHNTPFFFLTKTRGSVIHPEYALCLSFLLYCLVYCSCFSLECSLAYTTAFSRFSFIF